MVGIAVATILLALFLRVNSIVLFTSVAVGDLLMRYMGENASLVVAGVYRGANADIIAKLSLLLIPVILTLFFSHHSLSKAKTFLHIVPIIATGIVLSLLILTQLPRNFQDSVYNSRYGTQIKENQDLAIAAAGVASLVVAWITNETSKAKHSKKH